MIHFEVLEGIDEGTRCQVEFEYRLSRPESRSDPIGGSEPVSGTRDQVLGLLT